MGRMQWYTSLTPGIRDQKQKDLTFKTSLGCIVAYIVTLTVPIETAVSQIQKASLKVINSLFRIFWSKSIR